MSNQHQYDRRQQFKPNGQNQGRPNPIPARVPERPVAVQNPPAPQRPVPPRISVRKTEETTKDLLISVIHILYKLCSKQEVQMVVVLTLLGLVTISMVLDWFHIYAR